MVGRLSSKWINLQTSYYSTKGNPQLATLWMDRLCRQLILITHAMWLAHNQQVQEAHRQQELASLTTAIQEQFRLDLSDLLPPGHFYVTPGPQGFSLQQVPELPIDDQQLWLHAVATR